jgi:2-(1,2-epoxy-1,2-dihydrophenyl)acetyl-CoA isomerase
MQGRHAIYELADGIATFTINRPEARNALSGELQADFRDLIAEVRGNDTVRALIVTGAGGAFCAGGDVKAMERGLGPAGGARGYIVDIHGWLEQLYNLDCPVIAAVDGPAFGGGFSLALACDFVLATPRARFCAVFARIGLIPDMAMLHTLPRVVGMQRAKELMYTARTLDAREAQDLGLVLSVHEPDALLPAARALAGRLAVGSKTAQELTKAYVQQSLHTDYRGMMEMEVAGQTVCFDSDFHRDAVRRFTEKQALPYNWDAMADAAGE